MAPQIFCKLQSRENFEKVRGVEPGIQKTKPKFVKSTIKVTFLLTNCSVQCREMLFASFLSGVFITAIIVNPPERKLAKRTFMKKLPTENKLALSEGLEQT